MKIGTIGEKNRQWRSMSIRKRTFLSASIGTVYKYFPSVPPGPFKTCFVPDGKPKREPTGDFYVFWGDARNLFERVEKRGEKAVEQFCRILQLKSRTLSVISGEKPRSMLREPKLPRPNFLRIV